MAYKRKAIDKPGYKARSSKVARAKGDPFNVGESPSQFLGREASIERKLGNDPRRGAEQFEESPGESPPIRTKAGAGLRQLDKEGRQYEARRKSRKKGRRRTTLRGVRF